MTVFSDTLPVRREFHSVAGIGREGSPDRFEPGTWNASRGLYRWVDSNVTEQHSPALALRCMGECGARKGLIGEVLLDRIPDGLPGA